MGGDSIKIKRLINIIKGTNFADITSRGAEVSFYLILSLFPFLMFTISSAVYIPIITINRYIEMLESIMPDSTFDLISYIIVSAVQNKNANYIIVSFVLTIWTLGRTVRSLTRGLNKFYKIRETRSYIKTWFIGMIFTVAFLALIISTMIFLVFGEKLGYFVFNLVGLNEVFMYLWTILRYVIGICAAILMFVALYKFTPNMHLSLFEVLPGAIVSTFGWLLVSLIYSFYTNNFSNYQVIYGPIGDIIVMMTWIYVGTMAILFGSEVNARLYFRRSTKNMLYKSELYKL